MKSQPRCTCLPVSCHLCSAPCCCKTKSNTSCMLMARSLATSACHAKEQNSPRRLHLADAGQRLPFVPFGRRLETRAIHRLALWRQRESRMLRVSLQTRCQTGLARCLLAPGQWRNGEPGIVSARSPSNQDVLLWGLSLLLPLGSEGFTVAHTHTHRAVACSVWWKLIRRLLLLLLYYLSSCSVKIFSIFLSKCHALI